MKKTNKQTEPGKTITRRSEEITDIVERMPMTFGRWVAVAVVIFTALLLLFGWLIKYPDTVTGQIRINSSIAPVKLVANASGNIHLMPFQSQDNVKQGDYIAVVENSAVTEDVRQIANLIDGFNPNDNIVDSVQVLFPENVSMGDLNSKYFTFLSALKDQRDYWKDNVFETRRIGLVENMQWGKTLQDESEKLLKITQEKLDISRKWMDKYASMNRDEIITYELELDKSRNELLANRQEEQNLRKEIASVKMQIADNQNKLNQLDVEQKEKERQLQMNLLASYQELMDNIKAWEQKFVFKAPFEGKVEFLKFLSENQFVQTGEEIFGIVPKENDVFGQVLLPATGAGKVENNSRVTVKLDNYPYMEYGSVDGRVSSISLLSQPQKAGENIIETYLIVIDFPSGLTTNYGKQLDFRYEISGTADIIVKERRLIERLFDNLKYRTK
ncbi:MAG: HlyD family secretion protein [Dysgonamonadaceae bacterium]|jgi:multidrug resistance efflux pump|nr:HlyD family secretion protein [Dysgonamonadaceae bacterium]